jgi:hypothetical protein
MPRLIQNEEFRRQYRITIRLEEAEYEKICSESQEAGITLSTYIRSKVMTGRVYVPKYAKIDSGSINQLSKLGGLFKKSHTEDGGVYRKETAAILGEITSILKEVRRQLENDRETHSKP